MLSRHTHVAARLKIESLSLVWLPHAYALSWPNLDTNTQPILISTYTSCYGSFLDRITLPDYCRRSWWRYDLSEISEYFRCLAGKQNKNHLVVGLSLVKDTKQGSCYPWNTNLSNLWLHIIIYNTTYCDYAEGYGGRSKGRSTTLQSIKCLQAWVNLYYLYVSDRTTSKPKQLL